GPPMALGGRHTPVPRRPAQQLDARGPGGCQQVGDVSCPVTKADPAALGTPVLGTTHGRQTAEPLLAVRLADGPRRAPRTRAHVGRGTGPDRLGQQPQGETRGRERPRPLDEQPLTGSPPPPPPPPRRAPPPAPPAPRLPARRPPR